MMGMENYFIALTTFFATVGPLDTAVLFAGLTAANSSRQNRALALRGVITASLILLVFAFAGDFILNRLGVSLAALRIAGGILLLLIGIDMTFVRASGASGTTPEEADEASVRTDIAIFPLATPLLAGPGAISAAVLLMTGAEGDTTAQVLIIAAMLTIMALTLCCLIIASYMIKKLSLTGVHVIGRIFGIFLCTLAVQFVIDGLVSSGLLAT